jgi:hypothetical protein
MDMRTLLVVVLFKLFGQDGDSKSMTGSSRPHIVVGIVPLRWLRPFEKEPLVLGNSGGEI